jgi:hypothetical protein
MIFTQERWDNLHPDLQKVLEEDSNVEVIING